LRARAEALSWTGTERCCCLPEDCGPEYWKIGERRYRGEQETIEAGSYEDKIAKL